MMVIYAFLAACWMRTSADSLFPRGLEPLIERGYLPYMGLSAASLLVILGSMGIYEKQSLLRYRYVGMQVLKGCLVWFFGFLSLSYILHFSPAVPRSFVLIAGLNVTVRFARLARALPPLPAALGGRLQAAPAHPLRRLE